MQSRDRHDIREIPDGNRDSNSVRAAYSGSMERSATSYGAHILRLAGTYRPGSGAKGSGAKPIVRASLNASPCSARSPTSGSLRCSHPHHPRRDIAMSKGPEDEYFSQRFTELLEAIAFNPNCAEFAGRRWPSSCSDDLLPGIEGVAESSEPVAGGREATNARDGQAAPNDSEGTLSRLLLNRCCQVCAACIGLVTGAINLLGKHPVAATPVVIRVRPPINP